MAARSRRSEMIQPLVFLFFRDENPGSIGMYFLTVVRTARATTEPTNKEAGNKQSLVQYLVMRDVSVRSSHACLRTCGENRTNARIMVGKCLAEVSTHELHGITHASQRVWEVETAERVDTENSVLAANDWPMLSCWHASC